MLLPNQSIGYATLFSLVSLVFHFLSFYFLSYCGYVLRFHCINSRPSRPSEINMKFLSIPCAYLFLVYDLTIEPFFNIACNNRNECSVMQRLPGAVPCYYPSQNPKEQQTLLTRRTDNRKVHKSIKNKNRDGKLIGY